jgi:SAM-dependent methyltransferase
MTEELAFQDRGACALCGGAAFTTVLEIDRLPIRKCQSCGFRQVGRVLAPSALDAYYVAGYGGLRMRQGQEVNAIINEMILDRLKAFRPGGKLLDVGCGYGFLLQRARTRGMDVTGVELAESERQFGQRELQLDIAGSLDDVAGDEFDVICLFEVIEHITDPVDFVRTLSRRLRPGGLLVIGTDNFESAVAHKLGAGFPKLIPHQHISDFSATTLPDLIARAGGLGLEKSFSFTPWELVARLALFSATGGKRGAKQFRLADELGTENSRPYRLFGIRKRANLMWTRATLRRDLAGEMMFVSARKDG